MGEIANKNGNGRADRVEFLKQKMAADRAALAKEMMARAKREKRETNKLDVLLGSAVRKTGAQSAEFRLMIAQTALCNVTDEKARRFLTEKGWL